MPVGKHGRYVQGCFCGFFGKFWLACGGGFVVEFGVWRGGCLRLCGYCVFYFVFYWLESGFLVVKTGFFSVGNWLV